MGFALLVSAGGSLGLSNQLDLLVAGGLSTQAWGYFCTHEAFSTMVWHGLHSVACMVTFLAMCGRAHCGWLSGCRLCSSFSLGDSTCGVALQWIGSFLWHSGTAWRRHGFRLPVAFQQVARFQWSLSWAGSRWFWRLLVAGVARWWVSFCGLQRWMVSCELVVVVRTNKKENNIWRYRIYRIYIYM